MPEANLHVTLAFLGERPEGDVATIAAVLDGLAGSGAPALRCDEAIALPPRRPRVAAVRLEEAGGGGVLAVLQSRVAAGLAAAGVHEPERRAFLAHVTAGRARERRPGALPEAPACAFTALQVVLYRSQTGGGGARYAELASARLDDGTLAP